MNDEKYLVSNKTHTRHRGLASSSGDTTIAVYE